MSDADDRTTALRDVPRVRRLGPGVPYVDGSEGHLLDLMRRVDDLGSGSDELESHIVDWPTRYHLSHQRSNLLRPLRVAAGVRVLDVGAGTGALARYLGEQGATVLAVEGNMARAEVAAVRCSDLPNVEVVCGTIDDLDPALTFDMVAVIGVLEYSVATIGGGAGAQQLLRAVFGRLAPGGVIALAIENQFGLKYLLGGAEDHRGVPWIGLEDYPGPQGPRTWSRRELAAQLREAGFAAQTWLAPMPDYKLPQAVLHERIYDEPDADDLIDGLVARPVTFPDAMPARLADAAAAHRALVKAGMGLDVASSFLVVAGVEQSAVDRFVPDDVLAWLYTGSRRSPWRRHRVLTMDRQLVSADPGGIRADAWLSHDPGASRPFEPGRTLGQAAQSALRSHDLGELRTVLRRWWAELRSRAQPASVGEDDRGTAHPFLPPWSEMVLPDGHLDVGPSNFVDRGDALVFIDDEWRVGAVDLNLAAVRALWVMSQEIVGSGISHPWGERATVGEVFDDLTGLIDIDVRPEHLEAFRLAEIELQHLVTGQPEAQVRATWLDPDRDGLAGRVDRQLALEVEDARARLPGLVRSVDELRAHQVELDALVADLERRRAETERQRDQLVSETARLRTLRGFVRARLARSALLRRLLRRGAPRE